MAGRAQKDSGTYGGNGLGGPSGNRSTQDKNLDALSGGISLGKDAAGANATSKGKTKGGSTAKGKLPSSLNPLKYQTNPTQSFEPTPSNLAKVGGTLVSTLAGPIGTAVVGAATGIDAAISGTFDPMNPFDKPTGTVNTGDYDKSETTNASIGNTNSTMGPDATASALETPEQKKRKKVAAKPGFNLLTGAGGTLLGN